MLVQEGQSVKGGDVLFTIYGTDLQEAIDEKEDTVEELTLKISDLESQAAGSKQKAETEKSYAEKSYSQAVESANVSLDNAQEELNEAKQRLQEYYSSQAQESFSDGTDDASDDTEQQKAEVEALRADETDDSIRTVSILLPEGSLSIGQTASFTIAKSEGPFASCVPLSALYQENGSWYVYVVDSSDSVLGEVLTARRVEVTVTDKNETLAALGGGVLTFGQQIIVESDREISEGSRVRLAE